MFSVGCDRKLSRQNAASAPLPGAPPPRFRAAKKASYAPSSVRWSLRTPRENAARAASAPFRSLGCMGSRKGGRYDIAQAMVRMGSSTPSSDPSSSILPRRGEMGREARRAPSGVNSK